MKIETSKTISRFLFIAIFIVTVFYFIGIIWTNLNAKTWFNFDLYSDAKLAQLINQTGSLFPQEWTFGNQLYVIATPVIASILYPIISDSALALGIASCIMTVLLIASFIWCIGPFVHKKQLLVGIACLIGGVLVGESASSDFEGFQLFFTMGSYYSCYLLGILISIGIWLRMREKHPPHIIAVILCLLINIALGMQSLRQMLCLNLPLCTLSLLLSFMDRSNRKTCIFSNWTFFSVSCLAANFTGIILIRILKNILPIHQADILTSADGQLLENLRNSLLELAAYIGITRPNETFFSYFSLFAGIICLGIVVLSIAIIIHKRDTSALACVILFCIISIIAVLCAGTLMIQLRAIYFFVWHLAVTVSIVYLLDILRIDFRNILCAILLILSTVNLFFQYREDIAFFSEKNDFYQKISDTLIADGITQVYYNVWGMNDVSRVAAASKDQLLFCAVTANSENPEEYNLFSRIPYLYSEDWFDPSLQPSAYLCLTGDYLKEESHAAYAQLLEPRLTLVHRFTNGNEDYAFYSFDHIVYRDLVNFQ